MQSHYFEKALKVLKESNFRITKPRQLVIKLLDKSKEALSAYEIKDKLENSGKEVDTVSIYRIIECLEEKKLVHRVLTTNKVMKCQLKHEEECNRHQDHHCHHLLICQKCNLIEEVHCAGVTSIIKKLEKDSKFKIKNHNIEFYGTCNGCTNN